MIIFKTISRSRFNQLKKNPQKSSVIHKSGKFDALWKLRCMIVFAVPIAPNFKPLLQKKLTSNA